jgi:hypothetical protein
LHGHRGVRGAAAACALLSNSENLPLFPLLSFTPSLHSNNSCFFPLFRRGIFSQFPINFRALVHFRIRFIGFEVERIISSSGDIYLQKPQWPAICQRTAAVWH